MRWSRTKNDSLSVGPCLQAWMQASWCFSDVPQERTVPAPLQAKATDILSAGASPCVHPCAPCAPPCAPCAPPCPLCRGLLAGRAAPGSDVLELPSLGTHVQGACGSRPAWAFLQWQALNIGFFKVIFIPPHLQQWGFLTLASALIALHLLLLTPAEPRCFFPFLGSAAIAVKPGN